MLERLIIVAVVISVASLAYMLWSRRDGQVQHVQVAGALTPDDIGAPRGQRATLVQFSTPVCAKCPPTRELLLRVSRDLRGVEHVEVDASEHLDLARRLNIMRTPTTLILDGQGVVVSRINGATHEAQVREAIAEVPEPGDFSI